jgi:hypothetical protein
MGEICSKYFRTTSVPPRIIKVSSNKQIIEINIPISVENTVQANMPFQQFYNENVNLE